MNVAEPLNTLGKSMIGKGMALIKTRVGTVVGAPLVAMGSLAVATGYTAKTALMIGSVAVKTSSAATKMLKDAFSKKEKQPEQTIANQVQPPENKQTVENAMEKSQEYKAKSLIMRAIDRSVKAAQKEQTTVLMNTNVKSTQKQNLNPAILARIQKGR